MLDDNDKVEQYLTREQAKLKVRRAPHGTRFYLSLSFSTPIKPNGEHIFPRGGRTYVQMSRTKIQEVISDMFSDTLENRGAHVRVFWWKGNDTLNFGN